MAPRIARRAFALCFITLAAGCGGERLEPVEGRISVNGKPLPRAGLLFKPIGDAMPVEPAGNVEADGVYKIFTNKRPGAPAGSYKVIVIAQEPIDPDNPYVPRSSLIDTKYNTEATTDLTIEVRAGAPAGAYDLDLKK